MLKEVPNSVRAIVVHPDLIADPGAYLGLGWRLCVENMDSRKSFGQSASDLEQVFAALPDAGFVLDLAHVREVDPSLDLASDLLDRFGVRLREVHISSIVNGSHDKLTSEDEERFGPLLARCRDVPWIFEAAPPDRWQAEAPAKPSRNG